METTVNQNSVVYCFDVWLIIGGKSSKMAITLEERPIGPYLLGFF
jgi:hypothetical protein